MWTGCTPSRQQNFLRAYGAGDFLRPKGKSLTRLNAMGAKLMPN